MQKKIIALAIAAAASSAAFAQTNVTLYGIADVGIAQYRGNGDLTGTKVISGGLSTSRIGFKGTEDLGNGLKAIFALEYRLDIDGNNGIGGDAAAYSPGNGTAGPARQQLVGLTGGFGTVAAGRLQTTAFDWQVKYQTLSATAFDVHNALTKTGFRINLVNDARANNAVAYISPSMGGVTVALNHSFAAEQGSTVAKSPDNLSASMIGLYYDRGPLSVGFVGEKLQGGGASEGVERTDLALGASYDFGVAKLTAAYQTTKNNGLTAAQKLATPDGDKFDSVWSVGAQVPVSAKGKVHVVYAQSNLKSGLKTATTVPTNLQTTGANGLFTDNNGKGIAVAYTHDLSKRTTAYAGYAYLDNTGAGDAYALTTSVKPEGSSNVIAAGVRHAF